jgi:hypothetical protein
VRRALSAALLVIGASLTASPVHALDIERNFAGSAQLDYLAVPTDIRAHNFSFDGFTTELAIKLAVDFTPNISANVKVCYGCHGFETDMAFVDLRVADQLNFRIGRINPSFGDFPLRHDPANHRSNDKPLPYDMGRMLHRVDWNNSVMPAPYVDNGLEVNGTQWFGSSVQLDYAAYAVSGFKGNNDGYDFDFIQSRSGSLYYVDNNSEPAGGGRLALTLNFTDEVNGTFGVSGMYGHYDPQAKLSYAIGGADVYLRFFDLSLRAEYLIRRTEFFIGADPTKQFRYAFTDPTRNFFTKDGWYAEVEYPFTEWFEALFRFDGLRRNGNVPITSPLRSESAILRYTLGLNFIVERGLRIKLSGEYWDFSDFKNEVAAHAGVVANF